jgi:GTP cyclohydrolase I
MRRTKFNAIECQLCHKKYMRITNTHLWKEHQITVEEYKQLFPEAPIDADGLSKSRVDHLTGKTYEEIYGKGAAKQLKKKRKKAAITQMQDSQQIKLRKDTSHIISEKAKKIIGEKNTQHGGTNYRKRALKYYGLECERCGLSTENPVDFIVYHRDLNNFKNELGNHSIENLVVLCKSCHAKLHNELAEKITGFTGINSVEKGIHYILKGLKDELGLDLSDENLKDTPKRVARLYAEIFSGVKNTKQQIDAILNSAFPCEFDEMIIAKDIEVFSMCPHHLLPVHYVISVAYIPSVKTGKVIGISKLSRLVEILAKRPILQEQLVIDITNALLQLKGCQGAACVADGVHYCMVMRGAKQTQSHTITSSMKGSFFTPKSAARQEFLQLIKK